MRKLIFFIFLIPAIIALGHDIYIFTENQDKGFRLSDIGAIWTKYDQDSHDEWRAKLKDIEKEIIENVPEALKKVETQEEPTTEEKTELPDYAKGFAQIDKKNQQDSTIINIPATQAIQEPTTTQSIFTFILEQKAVLFFGGIALFLYLTNLIITFFLSTKEGMDAIKKHKKKNKGAYEYKRK